MLDAESRKKDGNRAAEKPFPRPSSPSFLRDFYANETKKS